ncbi:MAG: hypothetical protein RLO52_30315 [Sandaracinaceae bacterium]
MNTGTPYPADWTVRQARDAYLEENGFDLASYEDPWTKASVLGIPFWVPNTARHRWAIRLHDLHHCVTGFGTDLTGEGEVSAWEARRGLRSLGLYVGAIVAFGTLMGFALAPRRALRAWRAAGTGRSLFDPARYPSDAEYEALLDRRLGDVRRELGVPEHGSATAPRGFHRLAAR